MERRRYINFRAFLIVAVSVVLAAIFAFVTFAVQWLGWLLFALGIAFFCTAIFFSLHLHIKPHKFLTFAVGAVLFIAVFFNFIATVNLWHNDGIADGEKYPVSGTVDAIYDQDDKTVIVLKNLNVATVKHRGKMKVYAPREERLFGLRVGDKVEINSITLYKNFLISDGKVHANFKRTDVRYNASAFSGDVVYYHGSPSPLDRISEYIKDLLLSNMGSEYGGTAYGMLTGDKTGISEETFDAFRLGGISHVLAVSGLHVGFAAMIITFIMRRLKIGRIPIFITVSAFLVFYVFLADFSPSVIRAAVMTETGFAAAVLGKGKDRLSALCFAVAVMLTFSPIYLFEAGFLMSVGAVFGIILFSDFFCKVFRKIRFPKFIASPLSASLSVQIGIMPAQIYNFNSLQVYSVFCNVLLMPLIAAAFCVTVVILIFACVIPFLGVLLKAPTLGLYVINIVVTAIGKLPYAVVKVPTSAAVFLAYPVYFLISRFFMLGKAKLPVKIPLVLLSGALLFHGFFAVRPYEIKNAVIPVFDTTSVVSVVITDGGTYAVGDMYSYYPLRDVLTKYRITKLDAVYMTNLNERSARNIVRLAREFETDAFFAPDTETIDGLAVAADGNIGNFYLFSEGDKLGGGFGGVFSDGKFICYELPFSDKSVLFYGVESNYTETDTDVINRCAVIRTFGFENEFSDRLFIVNKSLSGFSTPPRGFSAEDERGLIFDFLYGEYLAVS